MEESSVWGSGSEYPGNELTKHGVILITVNYRLGPFGFFYHPELSIETGEERGRTSTATRGTAGMAPSPDLGRDYYGCSVVHGALYRIFVEADTA